MWKQYIKLTWFQLKQQPIISTVSILGTALSICLIMLFVMIKQVKVAPIAPESNRDRFLHTMLCGAEKGEENTTSGMSTGTFNAVFGSLTTPEAVTSYDIFTSVALANIPGQYGIPADVKGTDGNFWKVFDFNFIDGKPYTQVEFKSEIPVAVISETISRKLFGTSQSAGREFQMSHKPYRVIGVVKDASILTNFAYAQIWAPYSVFNQITKIFNQSDKLTGMTSCTILAKNKGDLQEIRNEVDRKLKEYNKSIASSGYKVNLYNQPYDHEKATLISLETNKIEPDVAYTKRIRYIVFLILLIVPAINLSSMTQSRFRQRVSEIGVRRAFGCTRRELVMQLLSENLILTLAGGILGLLLSIVAGIIGESLLFIDTMPTTSITIPEIHMNMLLQPSTFFLSLLFCFILNLMSTGIPAWHASKTNIVNALEGSINNNR